MVLTWPFYSSLKPSDPLHLIPISLLQHFCFLVTSFLSCGPDHFGYREAEVIKALLVLSTGPRGPGVTRGLGSSRPPGLSHGGDDRWEKAVLLLHRPWF